MNFGAAFSFPFKDPDWGKKLLIGALVTVSAVFLIGIFVLAGYFVQVTQRTMRREVNLLPKWEDIGVMFVIGFKYCVAFCVYLIPIFLLLIPIVVISILEALTSGEGALPLFTGVYTIVAIAGISLYALVLTLFTPIITYRFAEHERITDALDISSIVRLFTRNWQNTTVVALISMGIESFAGIGILFFFVGILFTIFYSYLVAGYLYGLLYLEQAPTDT